MDLFVTKAHTARIFFSESTAAKHILAALEETVARLKRVSAILQRAGKLGRLLPVRSLPAGPPAAWCAGYVSPSGCVPTSCVIPGGAREVRFSFQPGRKHRRACPPSPTPAKRKHIVLLSTGIPVMHGGVSYIFVGHEEVVNAMHCKK